MFGSIAQYKEVNSGLLGLFSAVHRRGLAKPIRLTCHRSQMMMFSWFFVFPCSRVKTKGIEQVEDMKRAHLCSYCSRL